MPPEKQLVKQTGAKVSVRQDLTADEITVGRELSTEAAAAAARAEVEAARAAAHRWPRNEDEARLRILRDCRRPGFAETALYKKPVGRKQNAEGKWENAFAINFSVRFVEGAIRHWGNTEVTARIDYEDEQQARLRVRVLDLETNTSYATDAVIDKLVERKEVKEGRQVRGRRQNSYGDIVYLVDASKDEFRNLAGAERSKLIRDNGQRLLPRDLLEDARKAIEETLADENAKDPDAAKKKILDRFASIGVSAVMLKEYIGKPFEALNKQDLSELGVIFNGLKDGEMTWAELMSTREKPAEGEPEPKKRNFRDRILAQQKSEAQPAAAPQEAPQPDAPVDEPGEASRTES